jgi:peptide chain release factor 1
MEVLARLEELSRRYGELDSELSKPEILSDPDRMKKAAKERADLDDVMKAYRELTDVSRQIEELQEIIAEEPDAELVQLAKEDLPGLKERQSVIENEIALMLLPKDPNDERNTFLEIRAGTGGEEAGLFASDLFRAYCRYAEAKRWRVEVMSCSTGAAGGVKEVIALIHGRGAYSRLKYERGVHRVQRIPETESQGRIHTSAVTVAVLPEAEEVDVKIDPKDLKIDVYRSSGPGGQSVNTTDSAVRVTHIPTNIVVTCQDEKSQHKNKAKALKILMARLLSRITEDQRAEISKERRTQVGSGDRSERIRTYNFPQNRVTDHRIGLTLHRLEGVLSGDLEEIINALTLYFQTEALKQSLSI